MGQTESVEPTDVDADANAVQGVREFSEVSKSGVGIHMFKFSRGDDDRVYLSSEVTDDNNVLDVEYKLWKKLGDGRPTTWMPIYTYGTGRVVPLVVLYLLRSGYTMTVKTP